MITKTKEELIKKAVKDSPVIFSVYSGIWFGEVSKHVTGAFVA